MAFNVNDYIKHNSKPFTNRIVDPIVSTATVGRPAGSSSVATSSAQSMLVSAGVSNEAIKAISTNTTVNATSEVADTYYAISGSNIARATRANLTQSRFGKMSTHEYMISSDPKTRIRTAKSDSEVQILTMV